MPEFDLRKIQIGTYGVESDAVKYTGKQSVGDAMTVNLELRFAEGRLYAESSLAEYLRRATGGTISIGVKYIPTAAQITMFGGTAKTRSVTPSGGTATSVSGTVIGAKDSGSYVGVSFYAPDMIDGEEKYTCVLVVRARFGRPSMTLQTMGDTITFQTPTTNGEFLPDTLGTKALLEVAVCDTEAAAIAWCDSVLS